MLFGKKSVEEPHQPVLQGEDFDIFPQLDDRFSYKPKPDEGKQPEAEDATPPEPTPFQQKMADVPENKWKWMQRIVGSLLGVCGGLSISFLSLVSDFFEQWGIIIAAALVLVLPNQFEKRAARPMPLLRKFMIFALILLFAAYALYIFVISPKTTAAG